MPVAPAIDALTRTDVGPTSTDPGATCTDRVAPASAAPSTGHASWGRAAAEPTPDTQKAASVNESAPEILDPTTPYANAQRDKA